MPPIMNANRKFKIIQEMLDIARSTGRFETATKFQRALIANGRADR